MWCRVLAQPVNWSPQKPCSDNQSFIKKMRTRQIALTAGLGIVAITYYAFTWGHELSDLMGDNALYLLMAQYLSPFGERSEIAAHFF